MSRALRRAIAHFEGWVASDQKYPQCCNKEQAAHRREALVALMAQLEREIPLPVLIEELKGTEGQPLYFVHRGLSSKSGWAVILSVNGREVLTTSGAFTASGCGKTWVAYRSLPKGVQ